ncbi:MAG: polyprenol monophosphomannose synthase [Deltaproteobacteria bacterium]|nr:polyprenol monophosphomannose synthase [Deltaproteobacteria bacterium]
MPSRNQDGVEGVDVSVVMPTYCEAENLPLVIPEVLAHLEPQGRSVEILVVDDASPDGTAEVARGLGEAYPVRVIERHQERGLATAVLAGFDAASGEVCIVMDADGSHPPSCLPHLLEPIMSDGFEIAVGSRHLPGGGFRSGSWSSQMVSRFAAVFAQRLSPISDPTSGLMAIRRQLLGHLDLDPVGWKIVLEIVVKAHPRPVAEVPILFDLRRSGTSKQSLRVFFQYLRHCSRLRRFRSRQGP